MSLERWVSSLLLRFRTLFRRGEVEQELDEELRYHIERQTELNLAAGMPPAEARRVALAAFGGVEYHKEGARDARGLGFLENTARDLRHSLRTIRKSPGFALIVVLSLALGLGTTTAVFHLTWKVLYAELPLPRPAELVSLARATQEGRDDSFSWAEYRTLSGAGGGSLAAMRTASQIALIAGEHREFANLHFVDGRFFATIELAPLEGRLISPDDDSAGAPVVVLSELLARRLFPDEAPIIGRTLSIRGAPFTVIGVAPRAFRGLEYPGQFAAAIPLSAVALIGRAGNRPDDRGRSFGSGDDRQSDRKVFRIMGRLPGDGRTARAALSVAFERCCSNPRPGTVARLEVIGIRRGILGRKDDFRNQVGGILTILLAGMGLVLVVVCCNIAGLLLVRASARQREIAVRLSLGASRWRLVRQLIMESIPLAVAGGVLGFLVARSMVVGLVSAIPEWDSYQELLRFQPGSAVLLFTGAITIGCGIACAVLPALRATRQQLGQALRLDARASRSRAQGKVARGVVVAQMGGTLVLVAAASLFAVTLRNLSRVSGGFATERVLLLSLDTRGTSWEQKGVLPLYEDVLRRVGATGGVQAAGTATMLPLFGGSNTWLEFEPPGAPTAPDQRPGVRMIGVAPGFFAATEIPLLSGHDFLATDRVGSQPVVIVSQTFVERYLRGLEHDPVGRAIAINFRDSSLTETLIVGVAGDAKYSDLRSAAEPFFYVPLAQMTGVEATIQLAIRTEGPPRQATPAVTRAIEGAAPGIRVRRVSDMVTQRKLASAVERLAAELGTFVSGMALVLSIVGLYGLVAFSVARRTSELGIRMALGARGRTIVWLVFRETLGFALAGVLLGIPLSYAANAALASQLFGIGAHDPAAVSAAVLLLTTAALVAGLIPARRAARIDPRIALNAD